MRSIRLDCNQQGLSSMVVRARMPGESGAEHPSAPSGKRKDRDVNIGDAIKRVTDASRIKFVAGASPGSLVWMQVASGSLRVRCQSRAGGTGRVPYFVLQSTKR